MSDRSHARILVIGEALVDVIHRPDGTVAEHPGGSPANVAITLGRLGQAPTLATCLGDDTRGDAIRSWLTGSGVSVAAHRTDRTSVAVARLDASGAADYEFDIRWDAEQLELCDADVVHLGSVGALLGGSAPVLLSRLAQLRPAMITYDPNVRPALLPDRRRARAHVESIVRIADVVKASDEDLQWLYPASDPLQSARRWSQWGPSLVVVTRGSDGATAIAGDIETHVPAVLANVADTVGAGDAFMGTLIAGLVAAAIADPGVSGERELNEATVREILLACTEAAGITVSRPGADPPTMAELTLINAIGAARVTLKE